MRVLATSEPHDHTAQSGGPVDIAIQCKAFPPIVRHWRGPIRISLSQPDPRSNFTHLLVLFHETKPPRGKWYKVHTWHLRGDKLDFVVKARLTRVLPHPFPLGMWTGEVITSPTKECVVMLRCQTLTMKPEEPPEPEEPRIILPSNYVKGPPSAVAPPDFKIILP